jgi:hypothetical protein
MLPMNLWSVFSVFVAHQISPCIVQLAGESYIEWLFRNRAELDGKNIKQQTKPN